jgi:hypothetical protein
MRRVADQDWRLVSNCHGGVHRTPGASAAEAKAVVRAGIAEAFESEGPSAREARRAASGYLVRMVAGPASCDEVVEAFVAWDASDPDDADLEPAKFPAQERIGPIRPISGGYCGDPCQRRRPASMNRSRPTMHAGATSPRTRTYRGSSEERCERPS